MKNEENEEIFEIAEKIIFLNQQKKDLVLKELYFILKNNITNENRIEHLIDEILDIDFFIDMKYYLKLILRYYSKINLQSTINYIQIYKEYNEKKDFED